MAPKKKVLKKDLVAASVYARIRPYGKDGHTKGEAVDKELESFDTESITIKDRNKLERFDFPKVLLQPDTQQEAVYANVAPELVDSFLSGRNHCLLFAYGQTGTGKTHTMFGPPESLSSKTPHEEWGLLPRLVDDTLKHIRDHKADKAMHLYMSCVEFYAGMCFDLNAQERNMVNITPDGSVFGHTFTAVTCVSEIASFTERVYGNRKVVATKMNSGSSRSHVVIILTLYQVDYATKQLRQTEFSVVDLAGSERPDKAGTERVDGITAGMQIAKALNEGKDLSPTLQGFLINFELTSITTAFSQATDRWSEGKQYKPQSALVPIAVWYLAGCATGHSRLATVVCISQSPQNGWETWFSCTWGQNVSKLRAPCYEQVATPIHKAVASAQKAQVKAATDLASSLKRNTPSAQKYALYRVGQAAYTEQRLSTLQQLQKMADDSGVAPSTEQAASGAEPPATRRTRWRRVLAAVGFGRRAATSIKVAPQG